MDPFSLLFLITGISALVGGITGLVTGEGFLPGMIHGAAWPLNVLEGGIALFTGRFVDAGLHLLGVSDQVIEDISSGEYVARLNGQNFFSVGMGENFLGFYDYRDDIAHFTEMGRDLLVGIGTVITGGLIAKYGATAKAIISKGTTFFMAGKIVGDFQNVIGDIANAIKDFDFSQIENPYYLETVITDLTGITGSSDRFNIDNPMIDVGDLFSTYTREEDEEVEA